MQTATSAHAIGACALRDIGCAFRNPTALACMAVALAFCAFYGRMWEEDVASGTAFSAFIIAFIAVMPVLEAGGVITLFAMSEELAHGSHHVITRSGVSLKAIVAGKIAASWLISCGLGILCFWAAGIDGTRLAPIAAVLAAGCLPFLVFSCGFGLLSKDQMRTNLWACPLALSALLALMGTMGPHSSFLIYLSPVGWQVAECVAALGPGIEPLQLSQPLLALSWIGWMGAGLFFLRSCMKQWHKEASLH